MHVLFSISGTPKSLWIDECQDLAKVYREIHGRLSEAHVELKGLADLPVRVVDEMLNALTDDRDQIILGELLPAK